MDNNNSEHYQENNISPVAAGITGFILGIVGTAAVALSDKQTRTMVTKKANGMKDQLEKWSKDTLHDMQTTGEEVKKRAESKMDDVPNLSAPTDPVEEAKQRIEESLRQAEKKAL